MNTSPENNSWRMERLIRRYGNAEGVPADELRERLESHRARGHFRTFIRAFGPRAASYYASGLTFDEAAAREFERLRSEILTMMGTPQLFISYDAVTPDDEAEAQRQIDGVNRGPS